MTEQLNRLENFKIDLKGSILTNTLAQQIELLINRFGDEYICLAEKVLGVMDILGYNCKAISSGYIYDYLTQLDYFVKNGDYGHKNYDDVKKSIYDNHDVMMNTYMPGLFLSYICTTILYEKYHLYLNEFIPKLNSESKGVEIGFGEGFYLWNLNMNFPGIKLKGFDISNYAKIFSEKLFSAANISLKDYDLQYGNIIEGIDMQNNTVDYAILAEVIEHIPEPSKSIKEIARILKKEGIFYLSTVIDSNHMDHMVNFDSPQEVENMLFDNGFEIMNESIYRIKDDYPESRDKSIGLAYVCKRL